MYDKNCNVTSKKIDLEVINSIIKQDHVLSGSKVVRMAVIRYFRLRPVILHLKKDDLEFICKVDAFPNSPFLLWERENLEKVRSATPEYSYLLPEIISNGSVQGFNYLVLPYYPRYSLFKIGRVQRRIITASLLNVMLGFLVQLARNTKRNNSLSFDAYAKDFLRSFETVYNKQLYILVHKYLRMLKTIWPVIPSVYTHRDVHMDNLIITGLRPPQFKIIDWVCMVEEGFPALDLIDTYISLRVSKERRERLLEEYCSKLGFDTNVLTVLKLLSSIKLHKELIEQRYLKFINDSNTLYTEPYLRFLRESKKSNINYFNFYENKNFAVFPHIKIGNKLYGLRYGGVWANSDNADFAAKVRKDFLEYCRQNNIKKVQIRNDPFIKTIKIGKRVGKEPFVYIDLRKSSDQLRNAISDRHLECIQEAIKEKLTFKETARLSYLKVLYKLYKETLERKGIKAEKFSYFVRISLYLKQNISFVYIEHRGEIIAISMIFKSKDRVFMMYGGTSAIGYKKYAKHFMIYNLILEYKKKRYTRLILGTGSQPGDSVYRFKRGFTNRDSYIYTYEATI